MPILYYVKDDTEDELLKALKHALPDEEFVVWPNFSSPEKITTAVVWGPPDNFFDSLSNLEHVLSMSAGVDHLLKHPGLPAAATIVRLHDAGMGEQMAEYVLYGALMAHRRALDMSIAQSATQWQRSLAIKPASEFCVGILGAGVLATVVANRLVQNKYRVSTWSRTQKQIEKVTSLHGPAQLNDFLKELDVLVCLLPLTEDTYGLINKHLLDTLPRGAFLINPGRGEHIVDDDLLEALDSGQVSGAFLDVFHEEPLPVSHSFWQHPRIIMTPHIAAATQAEASAAQISHSIKCIARNERPPGWVDRQRGY